MEDILKHRKEVQGNILKSFGVFHQEDDISKAEFDEFDKAKHVDGDTHPNGKWVWRQSANGGKGDWRVATKKAPDIKTTAVGASDTSKTTTTSADDDKKKSEKSSYESEKADAYDKGDGKVGNYSVPTHTSYPAANLYSRLNNNRHFGFKHGLPVKEIMEKLKDYKGNVNVSYHNNAGTSEIYRIKFL